MGKLVVYVGSQVTQQVISRSMSACSARCKASSISWVNQSKLEPDLTIQRNSMRRIHFGPGDCRAWRRMGMVNVAPVDPAMRTSVSYWRKFGGRPYGPSRKTGNNFSVVG